MKKVVLILIVILVIIQFIPALPESSPEKESTSLLLREDLPSDISSILKSSCNDCHSNSANWPWYAHVAPVSFWIGHHVEEGREHFNLSEWGNYNQRQRDHKIEELIEMVEEKEMPLESYTWIHKEADLSPEQRRLLIEYFKGLL